MATSHNCVICLDIISSDFSSLKTCGHVFHHKCLQHWLTMAYSCPVCRIQTNSYQMLKLFFEEGPMVDDSNLIQKNRELTEKLENKQAEIQALESRIVERFTEMHAEINNLRSRSAANLVEKEAEIRAVKREITTKYEDKLEEVESLMHEKTADYEEKLTAFEALSSEITAKFENLLSRVTEKLEDERTINVALKYENDILQEQLEELQAEKEEYEKNSQKTRRRGLQISQNVQDLLNSTIDLTYSPPLTPQPSNR